MKRTDKFDVEKVYSQLTSGENSAVVGFIHGDGEDNLRQLLARLEIEYVRNGIWTHEQDIDLQSMIPTMRFTPLAYELHRYVKSWTLFRTKRIDDAWSWEEWRKPEVQKEIQLMVQRFDPYMRHIAPCVICPYKRIHTRTTLSTITMSYCYVRLARLVLHFLDCTTIPLT
ncbi:hypothetical protein CSKR_202253 [Clonorchis sinensis]|uniref:Uncharacterized protein n=1 Tax=Clonorchis sinensis TaxID=79923 RepID=A0A8T1LXC7_CLOSI|nr:hypothetical protein CSKR_202253 [Clonorchis sinensis]